MTFPYRRGRGLRKLPATPTQPSTLNLGHLSGTDGQSNNFLGVDLFTFPRLETSPTRMKLLLQSLGSKKPQPQQQQQPPSVPARRSLPGRSIARWSRSLDDHPVTFEEAVIAGRGSRQLPVVGPQQLLASGRGRGLLSATKRELPQPRGLNVQSSSHHSNYLDSDEEEDWC